MGSWPNDVTEAELAILRVLWQCESATIREIAEHLYEEPSRTNYQTTKKLIARLEGKGFVDRDDSEATHVYWAEVEQEELIERRLAGLADTLCDGSTLPLLSCLLQGKKLSAKERRKLRDMFNQWNDHKRT